MTRTDLRPTNFQDEKLTDADLRAADVTGAIFEAVTLIGCQGCPAR